MNEYPYPYNQQFWNLNDQKYWCKLCTVYGYPVANVRSPFQAVIQQGRCANVEAEYAQYLASTPL